MTKVTDSSGSATQAPTAEQINHLALALAANGHGAEFCRWQRHDTEVWSAVADQLDRLTAAGGAR